MLRACAVDFGKGWVNHLPLVEFSYNNSYHASTRLHHLNHFTVKSAVHPFVGPRLEKFNLLVHEIVQETTEKIVQIKQRMQDARDRQKSYFDDKLQFVEEPVEIIDCEVKRLKRSRIPI
ncbi:putative reverse transcriptase domain-containing protein, partial [Tanacetum coccineum]